MRRVLQWHRLSSARLALERQRLEELPYFRLEATDIDEAENFTTLGLLHFMGSRSGARHEFRVRLEYPARFPYVVPRIFDHDRRFTPSLDGHLFTTYEICLTLPERHEFSEGLDTLTAEVLGATLIWFDKRLIFDRTKRWPGPAERHGLHAIIDLLVETQAMPDAIAIGRWLVVHATTPRGTPRKPDLYASCPCGSGKRLKFCHHDELRPLFKRLAQLPPALDLAVALDLKAGEV
jgi:hypothetical protein